jgi:hypothetical protein
MGTLATTIRSLIDQAAGDAYEIGHAHGGNLRLLMIGEEPQRVDEGWGTPAHRASDDVLAVIQAAAAPPADAPPPVDLDEVRARGLQIARILQMMVWPGGLPAVFGLHLSGDVGHLLQEVEQLRATVATLTGRLACPGLTEAEVDQFMAASCGRSDPHRAHREHRVTPAATAEDGS